MFKNHNKDFLDFETFNLDDYKSSPLGEDSPVFDCDAYFSYERPRGIMSLADVKQKYDYESALNDLVYARNAARRENANIVGRKISQRESLPICLFKPKYRLPEEKNKNNIYIKREGELKANEEQSSDDEEESEVRETLPLDPPVQKGWTVSESKDIAVPSLRVILSEICVSESKVAVDDGFKTVVPKGSRRQNRDASCASSISGKSPSVMSKASSGSGCVRKNRLCRFLERCRRKRECPYAHSNSELQVEDCRFGPRCRWVRRQKGVYVNIPDCRPCNFLHPGEKVEDYLRRAKAGK